MSKKNQLFEIKNRMGTGAINLSATALRHAGVDEADAQVLVVTFPNKAVMVLPLDLARPIPEQVQDVIDSLGGVPDVAATVNAPDANDADDNSAPEAAAD